MVTAVALRGNRSMIREVRNTPSGAPQNISAVKPSVLVIEIPD